MPTAKPQYDTDGSRKNREFKDAEWEALKKRLQGKLRQFYPDKEAEDFPPFGHPADEWANYLLNESWGAVSMTNWLGKRLTNEELRAERKDVLDRLIKADECLSKLSLDLDRMLGVDADVLGCRDKIREIIPLVDATGPKIARLPRAKKLREVQHKAAVEMTRRVLRILKDYGLSIAATADADLRYVSDAVKILQIIGDELGLCLSETTWKDTIIKAKAGAPDLQ